MAYTINNLFKNLNAHQRRWLAAYIDDSNPDTYMNNTESAIAAGYKGKTRKSFCETGSRVRRELSERINVWLDEVGLSEAKLKTKLLNLLESKQSKIIKVKGRIDAPEELPEGVSVLGTSTVASEEDDGETIVAINQEALETQRQSLHMAFKVKGMFAPEEMNITGLEALAERMSKANKRVNDE